MIGNLFFRSRRKAAPGPEVTREPVFVSRRKGGCGHDAAPVRVLEDDPAPRTVVRCVCGEPILDVPKDFFSGPSIIL